MHMVAVLERQTTKSENKNAEKIPVEEKETSRQAMIRAREAEAAQESRRSLIGMLARAASAGLPNSLFTPDHFAENFQMIHSEILSSLQTSKSILLYLQSLKLVLVNVLAGELPDSEEGRAAATQLQKVLDAALSIVEKTTIVSENGPRNALGDIIVLQDERGITLKNGDKSILLKSTRRSQHSIITRIVLKFLENPEAIVNINDIFTPAQITNNRLSCVNGLRGDISKLKMHFSKLSDSVSIQTVKKAGYQLVIKP